MLFKKCFDITINKGCNINQMSLTVCGGSGSTQQVFAVVLVTEQRLLGPSVNFLTF